MDIKQNKTRRIDALDLARSIAIILMMLHHTCYDLSVFEIIPEAALQTLGVRLLSYASATLFMLCSGISSRLSRNNLKRGAILMVFAMIVTAVTYMVKRPAFFGILHFFGITMIIYGLIGKYINKLKSAVALPIYLAMFTITSLLTENLEVTVGFLFPLGFTTSSFYSSDYYPILPWIFIFFIGTWLGGKLLFMGENKILHASLPKCLTWPGRHSLAIYMLHQPIIYFIVGLFARLSL